MSSEAVTVHGEYTFKERRVPYTGGLGVRPSSRPSVVLQTDPGSVSRKRETSVGGCEPEGVGVSQSPPLSTQALKRVGLRHDDSLHTQSLLQVGLGDRRTGTDQEG